MAEIFKSKPVVDAMVARMKGEFVDVQGQKKSSAGSARCTLRFMTSAIR